MENSWQLSYEAGKKAFNEKRYEAALASLEQVAREKSGFADVFNMLGFIYYHFSRHDDAVKALKRALEINPAYTEAALNLSIVYNETGNINKSREIYAQAKEKAKDGQSYLDPYVKGKLANMHAEIGYIYKDLGVYGEAVTEFKKALGMRPDFVDIKTELGIAYRGMKEYESSLAELQGAVNMRPELPLPRVQLGLTYYLMGDKEKAREEWAQALSLNPKDRLAKMYMNLLSPAGK